MSCLGKNIVALRGKRGISQAEISTSLGFTRSSWSNWENDYSDPDTDTIIVIAKYFGVSVDDLLTIDLSNTDLIKKSNKGKKQLNTDLSTDRNTDLKGENDHNSSIVSEPVTPYNSGTGTPPSGDNSLADQLRQAQELVSAQAITIQGLLSTVNHLQQQLSSK